MHVTRGTQQEPTMPILLAPNICYPNLEEVDSQDCEGCDPSGLPRLGSVWSLADANQVGDSPTVPQSSNRVEVSSKHRLWTGAACQWFSILCHMHPSNVKPWPHSSDVSRTNTIAMYPKMLE